MAHGAHAAKQQLALNSEHIAQAICSACGHELLVHEAVHAWEKVAHRLHEMVGESTFEIWLASLAPVGFDGHTLTLISAAEDSVAWLKGRYGTALDHCAREQLGAGAQIEITSAATTRPLLCPECSGKHAATENLRNSGMPSELMEIPQDYTPLEGQRIAFAAARAWALERGPSVLLLHGDTGRGKTYIAAFAGAMISQFRPLRWVSVPTLVRSLRFPFASPEYRSVMQTIAPRKGTVGDEALVLDDFDMIDSTKAVLDPLYAVIEQYTPKVRLADRRPPSILLTARNDLEKIERRFGAQFGGPIASRLADHRAVLLDGPDHRRTRPSSSG